MVRLWHALRPARRSRRPCGAGRSPASRSGRPGRAPGPWASADIQAADQIEVRLGVDLHVRHPVGHPGHLGQDPPGGPARRAERGGELHQRGPLAQRQAELGTGDQRPRARRRVTRGPGRPGRVIRCRRGAHPAVGAPPRQPGDHRDGERHDESDQSSRHVLLSTETRCRIPVRSACFTHQGRAAPGSCESAGMVTSTCPPEPLISKLLTLLMRRGRPDRVPVARRRP